MSARPRPELGPVRPGALALLGALSTAGAIGIVLVAEAIARGIAGLAAGAQEAVGALALGAAGVLLRGASTWAIRVVGQGIAISVKRDLRRDLWSRVARGGAEGGGTTILATDGLDDLDDYYASALPAAIGAAVVPLVLGLRILTADWLSAVVVALTIPLVPLFMALIGMHTADRTDAATTALTRLADHLAELARGLPVLVGLGRVAEQTRALERIQGELRQRTGATLRVAFLSALALELIATLSVAVVAVLLGVRLMAGDVTLQVALLALLLAPECFTALREVGAAFHASRSGLSALSRVRELLARPAAPDARRDARGIPRVDRLTVRYADRAEPALDGVFAAFPLGSIVAVTGPSGAGKSTLLAALTGTLPVDAEVQGAIHGVDPASVAYAPQAPRAFAATPRAELELYGARDAARVLDELGLAHLADVPVAELSPGELRRVAVGRALARVDAGATLLVLDEPTAHLDALSARLVRAAIRRRHDRVAVVLASHEPETVALAAQRLRLGDAPGPVASGSGSPEPIATEPIAAETPRMRPDLPVADASGRRLLSRIVRAELGGWIGATSLGVLATGLGLALTAVSGWLIVRASEERYIMYLLVAIVGVRFFGLGRSVARYVERLATHRLVFRMVDGMRLRLWAAIAARGAGSRRLLGGGTPLDLLVTQAADLRERLPRVLPPIASGVLAIAGVTVTTALAVPELAAASCIVLAGAAIAGGALALVAERGADRTRGRERSQLVRAGAALGAASGDLRANGVADAALGELDGLGARLAAAERRIARASGLGAAVVVAATSGLAVAAAALPVSAPASQVAVVALLALASAEPLSALVAAVHRAPALGAVLGRLAPVLDGSEPVGAETGAGAVKPAVPVLGPVRELELDGVALGYPGAEPLVAGVRAEVGAGEWLVVDGPSGSGKTTLLSVLLGALAPVAGRVRADGIPLDVLDQDAWRRRVAWCPQEAHVFDSTVRGNLLLARPRTDAPDDAELRDVLGRVGLGTLLAALPDGLDARVGPSGTFLSGGERQRLAVARALLTRADILLLDEPTAHLDAETAEAMMADIRRATADRIVVLVSHRAADAQAGDRRLGLRPAGAVLGAV